MKNILIIANTYFQLIVAIQMNETVFKSDRVFLLLSDHSNNSKKICDRLEEEKIFYDVGYFESKGKLKNRNIWKKIGDFFRTVYGRNNDYYGYLKKLKKSDKVIYDEIVVYNFGLDTMAIYASLYEKNREILISMYEEGIQSYNNPPQKTYARKILNMYRIILGKKDIWCAFKNFYCFYPEAYNGDYLPVKVPFISNGGKCSNILKKIFITEDLDYQEKYIYFTSVYDFEGGEPIKEFEIIENIAKIVGKDNLLIKMHPRDIRTVYKDNGYRVDSNSSIPWEVMQLCFDFSDKVLISTNSATILSANLLNENGVEAFYTFKLCDTSNNIAATKSTDIISHLLGEECMRRYFSRVHVIDNISEIVKKNE